MSHVTAEYLREQGLSPSFPHRFFSKIEFTESCWLWTGYRMPNGYGQIGKHHGRMMLAHRASWLLHFGPIPEGQSVLHDCPDGDCRRCVCPAHLWLGTAMDNVHDMFNKGRNIIGDHRGVNHGMARLTEAQVRQIRSDFIAGFYTRPELAIRYSMTWENINDILKGKRWTHILSDAERQALNARFDEAGKHAHVNKR